MSTYQPDAGRYEHMPFRRAGRSGLKLPALSLGLWQNFDESRDYKSALAIIGYAFDAGVTHFDLANNYGQPPGSAEELFGRLMKRELRAWRNEIVVSTKAGWDMWPGPYGNYGCRKYLIASADDSLRRLGLDYVDIFYSHRFDPNTPLEETMGALADLVRWGKALYVGISAYPQKQTREAHDILKSMGVALTVHQPSYSVIDRWIERDKTIDTCAELGIGIVPYGTLGHGLLAAKHVLGAPPPEEGGRMLPVHHRDQGAIDSARRLAEIARGRGQTPSQLALAWVLRRPEISSALIGVRTLAQLKENLATLRHLDLSADELTAIDEATRDGQLNRLPKTAA